MPSAADFDRGARVATVHPALEQALLAGTG